MMVRWEDALVERTCTGKLVLFSLLQVVQYQVFWRLDFKIDETDSVIYIHFGRSSAKH